MFLLSSHYEGFGRVVLESMLKPGGVPVVGTACTGPEDLIDDGKDGYLLPVGDHDGLLDRTLRLLRSPELARQFGSLGREKALRKWSMQVLINDLISLWGSCTQGKKETALMPSPNKRLLVFNLATDADHPLLGFTTLWIRELARHVEFLQVITMQAGRLDLPKNVHVHSVGKECGYSEPRRALEFYRILLGILRRERIDGCFSHMTADLLRARRAGAARERDPC